MSGSTEFKIHHLTPNMITIKGTIYDNVKGQTLEYYAAAPPDFRATYTGSGLPFANPQMAFDGSPNIGVVELSPGNNFTLNILYPNSYYIGLGTVIIPPTVYISYYSLTSQEKKIVPIQISKGIPYRLLTYPMQYTKARKDATFYAGGFELPVRSQEQILRDSAYPSRNEMSSDFWGLRPRQ